MSAKRAKVSSPRKRNQHFRAGNQLSAPEGRLVYASVLTSTVSWSSVGILVCPLGIFYWVLSRVSAGRRSFTVGFHYNPRYIPCSEIRKYILVLSDSNSSQLGWGYHGQPFMIGSTRDLRDMTQRSLSLLNWAALLWVGWRRM